MAMMEVQWLGFIGTGLVMIAYVPQLIHLVKARCTAGVSLWAYLVWTVSAMLLFFYAITTRDPVFISLQGYQLLALASIFLLSRRQNGRHCSDHCGMPADHELEIGGAQHQILTHPDGLRWTNPR